MFKKRYLIVFLFVFSMVFFSSCNGKSQNTSSTDSNTISSRDLTSSESSKSQNLSGSTSASQKTFNTGEHAKYTGLNGNPAYIAVDGVVYDVTNVPQWKDGIHKGQYQAGKDYTDVYNQASPHDKSIFNGVPVVGTFVK